MKYFLERYNIKLRIKYIFLVTVGFIGLKGIHDLESIFKKELAESKNYTKGDVTVHGE